MKFKSDIEVQAGLRDGSNDIGTSGQILSSTGSQTNWIDQDSIVASEAKLVVIECKNTSGSTISKGTPVYQTGTVGATDVIEIDAADASDEDKMAAIGLLQSDLANNAFGKVVITGELLNITTSPIDGVTPVTGDTIYVKSGGGLTLTKPTGVNFIQNIGLVGKVSGGSAGSITVSSIMRSNDVPTPLYIDHANQRLGIGLSSPATPLHVSGFARINGGLQMNTANATIYQILDSALRFGTNNTERMRIDNTGNVGIGTTSPDATLEIYNISSTSDGDGSATETLSGQDSILLQAPTGANEETNGSITWRNGDRRRAMITSVSESVDGDFKGISFYTQGTDGPGDIFESMRIAHSGNVGIGTTNPSQKLHVNGTTYSTNGYKLDNGFAIGAIGYNSAIRFNNGNILVNNSNAAEFVRFDATNSRVGIGTTSPSAKLEVAASATTSVDIAHFSNSNGVVKINNSLDALGSGLISVFDASNNEDIRLSAQSDSWFNAGNVGIGTTTPSEKLEVDGRIKLQTSAGSLTMKESGAGSVALASSATIVMEAPSNFRLKTGSSLLENFTVLSTGNVGIGTASPASKFEVYGGNSGVNDVDRYVRFKASNGEKRFDFYVGGTGNESILGMYTYDGTTKNVQISSSGTSYFNGGNVGIGTTSPSRLLDVDGIQGWSSNDAEVAYLNPTSTGTDFALKTSGTPVIRLDGRPNANSFINNGGNVGIGTTSPSAKLEVNGQTVINSTGLTEGFQWFNDTNEIFSLEDTSGAGELLLLSSNSVKVKLNANGNSYFNGGSVGINNTNPDAKLDVRPDNGNGKVLRVGNYVVSTYFYNTQADATIDLTCGSYYQAEVIITANQTNGGDYNNIYIRGIWSNNHTSHHWDEIESIGFLTGSSIGITVGQNTVSNSGKLSIDFNYTSASFSILNIKVTDFYGTHSYSIS
jgi:hypothetical protein